MNSNQKKDATLGMPHGTANNRLRKNILFHLLKKHDENYCVRCEQLIESVDDLSIEHIKPWEGISAELFWDLENIAFSHLHCNRPHVQGNKKYTSEEAVRVSREQRTRWARENYTSEARKEKYERTGH